MLIEGFLIFAFIGIVLGQDSTVSGFYCASDSDSTTDCDKVVQKCDYSNSTFAGNCCVSSTSIYNLNSGSPTTLVGGFPGGRCLYSTSTFTCNLIGISLLFFLICLNSFF